MKCEYFVCELTVKSEITGNHNTCPSGGSWRRTSRPTWTCRCTSVFHVPGRLLSRLCVLFSWSQKNHLSPSLQFRWRLCQTEQKSFTLLLFCSREGSISDNLNPFRLIHLWTLFLLQSPLCRSRRVTLFFFFNASVIFINETIKTNFGPKMNRRMPAPAIIHFYG